MSGGRARSVALQHQRLKRGTGMRRPMPAIRAFTIAARCLRHTADPGCNRPALPPCPHMRIAPVNRIGSSTCLPKQGWIAGPRLRRINDFKPRQLTSGRRFDGCTSARKGVTNLISGVFQPGKVASHPAGSNEAGRAPRIHCSLELTVFRRSSVQPLQVFRRQWRSARTQ